MVPSPSLNPFPWYRQMQQEKPVYYDPEFTTNWGDQGAWQVFRYEDVKRVLNEYTVFSNEYAPRRDLASQALLGQDPPVHRRLRSLISKAFIPKVINRLEPWIRQNCIELLEPHLDKGKMEFVKNYAVPIPVRVICQLLGVPVDMHEQVHSWSKIVTSNPAEVKELSLEEAIQRFNQAQRDFESYFRGLVQERQKNAREDLISELIEAETDDNQRLTEDEVVAFCIILLVAGNETTTHLIGSTLLSLIEHPELQRHLIENPTDIPKAIQESLRFRAPAQSMFRIAKQDTELGNQQIKKGQYVIAWIGSANHDPSVFPDPEKFDINRDNIGNLSFGHGIHYCIGAPLAKLESRVAFEVLLERIQNIELQPGTTLSVHPSTLIYGLTALPITFERR